MGIKEEDRKYSEAYDKAVKPTSKWDDYDVYATFADGDESYVGTLLLPYIRTSQDMPTELEIDGVVYYPQF